MDRLPEMMHSPRLTLRRWTVADVPQLAAAVTASIEHLRPWMPWIASEPLSDSGRVTLIEQSDAEWERGGDVVVGVFLGNTLIGSSGLHRRRGPGVLEVGYWVHVDHVRKGYATEVASTLTTAAFTVAGIDRVEIHHDKANVASGGVPRSLGFALVGETPDAVTSPGEVGIDCAWMIERQDWLARPSLV